MPNLPQNLPKENIFSDRQYGNAFEYFLQRYNCYPLRILFDDLNFKSLLEELQTSFSLEEKKVFYTQYYHRDKSEYLTKDSLFELDGHLLLYFCFSTYQKDHLQILYSPDADKSKIEKVQEICKKHFVAEEDQRTKLEVLVKQGGYYFNSFEIKDPNLDLERNYNTDFLEVDKDMKSHLNKKDENGLIILYGKPGTGKTYYIRHLIAKLDKRKLYIPPNLAEHIADPEFLSIFEGYGNSVLIIEDAETILQKRGPMSGSAVSNLLNLTDGLLADCFNIQIICTFNSSLGLIDEALLRKGRLMSMYEFGPLEVKKAQSLFDHLKVDFKVEQPMTLADIYNHSQKPMKSDNKKGVGFKFAS